MAKLSLDPFSFLSLNIRDTSKLTCQFDQSINQMAKRPHDWHGSSRFVTNPCYVTWNKSHCDSTLLTNTHFFKIIVTNELHVYK